ncbi:hypothetical protein Bca52824_069556 [Brassica carinata]|uniref:Exostosin GT47 domain-containing protein n=1 Tax=Brassica carinata TaxID=52824 RepID=A0A8X7Q3I0_BRACI|nr:hypothetical protein Bca52824_069556 [Brassica carinata]
MGDKDVDVKCKIMSACSSAKLFLFMVPLVVVSGFVFVNIGPKNPTSFLISLSTNQISRPLPSYRSLPPAPAPSPSPPTSSLSTKVESIQGDYDRTIRLNPINIASTSSNVTATASMKLMKKRAISNLEKIEFELQKARVAIKAASMNDPVDDPDYVPLGPMYWNAKVFHRSYLEMEKQFKIFVYKEGEPPLFHDGPCKSIYSMEGNFIYEMETDTRFRTNNPDKAHAFYLPLSVVKMVRYVYERDSHDFSPIRKTVRDYIDLVGDKYPYWNRSIGADHFILSCHDWGPEASFSHPHLGQNSIRALCNANTSERFKPRKDVSIPEINLRTGSLKGLVGGPSPSSRSILAFFAGGVHGPVRPVLLQHWENKDNDIRVHKYLPKGTSYSDMMRNSKFCLCPSGYEVASPRIVEALYSGCVPVLINSGYVPPFSDVLNWASFSVIVSVEDIPNLKTILTSISPRQYLRMYRRVLKVRRHFEVNSPAKRFDVFHMILHSIWVRRLNVKIREVSYLEMEKQFKIFVYKEGEPPLFHDGPCKSIYSMEGNFIYEMETDTRFRTNNPDKAHAFYLPLSVVKMVRYVYERDSHDFSPIRKTVRDYIDLVGDKYPYWNRSIGADHFILSCHDWGPEASFSHPHLGQNSIRALCNANTSERFKPRKDVSIPEINLRTGSLKGLVGGPSPSSRSILAFFAGGVHGPVRPVLLQHWENKDNDIRVHKYLPKGTSYSDMMRNSKFCLCPSGYEVASPRIVEALYSGCVPVLINSGYVPPFSDVLNWASFSVIVSVEDIPNLKTILTSISPRQYLRMYRRVLKVRRHFEVNSPAKRFDVFHMILHSIWVRRLNVKIREV